MRKLERPSKKYHVRLFEDQVAKLEAKWPGVPLAHIIRLALDRVIQKTEGTSLPATEPQVDPTEPE